MSRKVRVYELAKDLGLDSKVVIQEALNHGIEVSNHMSSLDDSAVNILRAFLEVEGRKPAALAGSAAHGAEPETELSLEDVMKDVSAALDAPVKSAPLSAADVLEFERSSQEEAERPAEAEMPLEAIEAYADDVLEDTGGVGVEEPAEALAGLGDESAEASASAVQEHERPTQKVEAAPSAPAEPKPVHRSLTDVPLSPSLANVVRRESKEPQRRGGVILGRRELPPPPPPPAARPRPATQTGPAGPVQRDTRFPGRDQPGQGGGGVILTKVDGGKRTFIRTGKKPTRPLPPRGRPAGPGIGGKKEQRFKGPRPELTPDHLLAEAQGPKKIAIELPITLKDLSAALGVKANVIIKLLMENGFFADINKQLDKETIELIGAGMEREIEIKAAADVEEEILEEIQIGQAATAGEAKPRAPIVTFLGHVDHGKTSLLDRIRKSNVAAHEHGGITQHLGAYKVVTSDGRSVVFLDTPGHKAFTEMRARGANITDVVVLVVAADDGVMPQTAEAINHAMAAEVPIVVAVNKVDKPEANVLRVKQQLAGLGLQAEEWGGKTVCVEVSAVTGQGVDQLIEYLALESDLLELTSNPARQAVGTVLDALHTKEEGNVARILITDGTLHRGDTFLCGPCFGKVKSIKDDTNRVIPEAGPATPVAITGFTDLVKAGDKFFVVSDVEKAKEVAEARQRKIREQALAQKSHVSLEKLFAEHKGQTLNIIVKADVTGSLEVLKKSINELATAEIKPKIIHAAVGGVSETDVALADASNAVILGFHVATDAPGRALANEKAVEIRTYQVIYKLIDELRAAMEGKLRPEEKEVVTGRVQIRNTFKVSRIGTVAGCFVAEGTIKRTSKARLIRDGIVIFETTIQSLRRFKDDVREVKEGFECGLILDRYDDVKVGDVVEAYEIEMVKRTLETV